MGRAAFRFYNVQFRTYWWPPRKGSLGTRMANQFAKKGHSSQAVERRSLNGPDIISFLDKLPEAPFDTEQNGQAVPSIRKDKSKTSEAKNMAFQHLCGKGIRVKTPSLGLQKQGFTSTKNHSHMNPVRCETSATKPTEIGAKAKYLGGSELDLKSINSNLESPSTINKHITIDPQFASQLNAQIKNPTVLPPKPKTVRRAKKADRAIAWINSTDVTGNQEKRSPLMAQTVVKLSKEKLLSKSVHVLGTGNVGRFIAHALVSCPEAPSVSLLVHRPSLVQKWYDEGQTIKLLKHNKIDSQSSLGIEISAPSYFQEQYHESGSVSVSNSVIENLIVATNGPETISYLSELKHRLRNYSTICFIQNGMGIIERVNSAVFPHPATRPSYMLGNITHDLQSMGSGFTVWERRSGALSLTIIPPAPYATGRVRRMDFGWTPQSRYIMRTLCRAPGLHGRGLLPHEFYKIQLEKLAIHAVLGPMSVVYDCTNAELIGNPQISKTFKLLLKEISKIIQHLPEVSHISGLEQDFCPDKLESIISSVIRRTGNNYTSMLRAVRDGRPINIDYFNGYLLSQAAELGIDCPNLKLVVAIVKGKQEMIRGKSNSYISFGDKY